MKALDIKLWRDLWLMKGQALAIVLVIVSGVTTFVMFLSVMHSLNKTRDAFYRDFAFAEVFGSLKRAPESLRERIGEIPGVNLVETCVAADVKLDIKGFNEPVTARLMSVVFERWGGDQPLSGRVRTVEPAGFTKVSSLGVEKQRVLVIVGFTSPPEIWEGLGALYRQEQTGSGEDRGDRAPERAQH